MDKDVQDKLNASILTNAKLAKAVGVLMEYHLSSKEKEMLSKRIDASRDLKELEDTMGLIQRELQRGYADPNTGEKWSPMFVEDIKGYLETGFPFNPMVKLAENFRPIKDFMLLQEVYIKLEDVPAKLLMKSELDEKRTECGKAITEFEQLLSELGG